MAAAHSTRDRVRSRAFGINNGFLLAAFIHRSFARHFGKIFGGKKRGDKGVWIRLVIQVHRDG